MKIKMFNEQGDIEKVETGSLRHKELSCLVDKHILERKIVLLESRIAVLEKALRLSCETNYGYQTSSIELETKALYFISKAMEIKALEDLK